MTPNAVSAHPPVGWLAPAAGAAGIDAPRPAAQAAASGGRRADARTGRVAR